MNVYHIDDGTWRFVVAARNRQEACRLLHCTLGELRRFGGRYVSLVGEACQMALAEPGCLWKQDMRILQDAPWVRSECCKKKEE